MTQRNVLRWFLSIVAVLVSSGSSQAATPPPVQILPSNTTNLVGYSFTLAAVLNEETLAMVDSYEWWHSNTNLVDNERVAGSTDHMLTIFDSQPGDSGVYRVVVLLTNATEVTATANVYILEAPVIRRVYTDALGDDVVLTSDATGGLLSYQWLWQGEPISGATNRTLRLVNAYSTANAGYYTVIVSNLAGAVTNAQGILFTKPAGTGSFYGLFAGEDEVTLDSSGYFQCTLSGSRGAMSGKLLIGKTAYKFSGAFSGDHTSQVTAYGPNGTNPLTLKLQLLTTNSLPQIVGTVESGEWVSTVTAHRRHFSSRLPTGLEGRYTLLLANTNVSATLPNGSGYARIMVRGDGRVQVAGYLPDGVKFAHKTYLSRLGDWPLRASIYSHRGSVLGWLRIENSTNGNVRGTSVAWLKAAGAGRNFLDGFDLSLLPVGSSFTLPAIGTGLPFTTGIATFHGGDLNTSQGTIIDSSEVTFRAPHSFIGQGIEQVRLKVDKHGQITGTFVHPLTDRKTKIRGAVLQQQGYARGYFLSGDGSGGFSLDNPN